VTSRQCVVALTYANLDYLGLVVVMFLDLDSKRCFESMMVVPGALGFRQPDTVTGADVCFRGAGIEVAFRPRSEGTVLEAKIARWRGHSLNAALFAAHPPGHETLNVVVPWTDQLFQFTSKHNTRPVDGTVSFDGRSYRFGPNNEALACLDFGRGIWPTNTVWNWGSASGHSDGALVGLQFGGQWTDGTGATENALCIDGRLTKISERVIFELDRSNVMKTWRVREPRNGSVDLRFTPIHPKSMRLPLGVAGGSLDQCFGHFSGSIIDASARRIRVEELFGWCEEVRLRW